MPVTPMLPISDNRNAHDAHATYISMKDVGRIL